jgi:hypothetical protein
MGDGSPLTSMLIVGHGSRGGSTSLSGVTAGEGDASGQRVRHGCSPWGCTSYGSGPPMDPMAALPVVTSASEAVSVAQIQPMGQHIPCRRPSHGRWRPHGQRSGHHWIWGLMAGCVAWRWRGSAQWIRGQTSPTCLLYEESVARSTWIQ